MRRLLLLVSVVVLSVMVLAGCSTVPKELLRTEEVVSLQVAGGIPSSHADYPKPFLQDNSEGQKVISKLIGWLNASEVTEGQTEYGKHGYPTTLEFKLKDGKAAEVEPAYNCETKPAEDGGSFKHCEPVKGEIVLTLDNKKIRLKSPQVYDWLQGGWKEDAKAIIYPEHQETGDRIYGTVA